MKKLFSISVLVAGAALAFAGTATAADMPVKARPLPPALYDWSGIYVGFHDGYEWASVRDVLVAPALATNGFETDSKVRNGIVGFHVGAQRQFTGLPLGTWVLGVEGGLNEPISQNNVSNFGSCANPAFACGIRNFKDNWYAGARLGLAFVLPNMPLWLGGDYLITVSGGWTSAIFDRRDFNIATASFCNNAVGGVSCTENRHDGGYVGVGLDHVLAKGNLVDWISGIDYQHQFYGDQTDVDVTGVGHKMNADVDIIRLRTTLKFK
jgi:outer membrane immunogenic protein